MSYRIGPEYGSFEEASHLPVENVVVNRLDFHAQLLLQPLYVQEVLGEHRGRRPGGEDVFNLTTRSRNGTNRRETGTKRRATKLREMDWRGKKGKETERTDWNLGQIGSYRNEHQENRTRPNQSRPNTLHLKKTKWNYKKNQLNGT